MEQTAKEPELNKKDTEGTADCCSCYDEVWAVDAARVNRFFRDNCDDVTVIPLPERTLGSMTMPQTRIIITGENADDIYHRFYLSFITAGG